MKKVLSLLLVLIMMLSFVPMAFAEEEEGGNGGTSSECSQHSLKKVDANEPSCTAAGNIEHYKCSICNALFEDEEGTKPTTSEAVIRSANGHSIEKVDAKTATCTEDGNTEYYKCSVCNERFKDAEGKELATDEDIKVAALGHNVVSWTKINDTDHRGICAREGCGAAVTENHRSEADANATCMQKVVCSECNQEYGGYAEHSYGDSWTYVVGKRMHKRTCSVCGVAVEAQRCTLEHVPEIANGCDTDGNCEHWKCNICEALFEDAEGNSELSSEDVVISGSHNLIKVDANDATCTEAGNIEHYKCSVCNALFEDEAGTKPLSEEEVTIPATGHSIVKVEAKTATCTEDGNSEYFECSVCHALFKDEAGSETATTEEVKIPATGHGDIVAVEAKAATCAEEGNTAHYKCSACNALFKDEAGNEPATLDDIKVERLAHTLVKVEAKASTCTEDGNIEHYKCSVCDALLKDSEGKLSATAEEVKIAAAHSYSSKWTTDKKATCTENGSKSHHCTICGAKTDVTVIKASGHKLASAVTPATTTKKGKVVETCTVCKKTISSKTIAYVKSIKLSKTSYTYSGKTVTPTVTVKDANGETLKKNTDYTVSYDKSRINPGKYSVKVKLKGNYSGSKTLSFVINVKIEQPTKNQTLKEVKGYKYTHTIKLPRLSWTKVPNATKYTVTVKSGSKKLFEKTTTYTYISLTEKATKLTKCGDYKVSVVAYKGTTKLLELKDKTVSVGHAWSETGPNCQICGKEDPEKFSVYVKMTPNTFKVNDSYTKKKAKLEFMIECNGHYYIYTTYKQPSVFTTKTRGTKTIVFTAYPDRNNKPLECVYYVK